MEAQSVATSTVEEGQRVLAGHDEYLFPCAKPLYRSPLVLEEGQGVWVRDSEGREYLDLFAGILTTSIGHCHPRVVQEVTEQMGRLGHTSTMYATANQVDVARRIADIAPGRLTRSFFTNSGTEAVETAIILASIFTGRTEVIALKLGYHGRSVLATNLTAHASWRPLASGIAGIKHAISPYPYRCPFKSPCDETCVEAFGPRSRGGHPDDDQRAPRRLDRRDDSGGRGIRGAPARLPPARGGDHTESWRPLHQRRGTGGLGSNR